MLVFRVKKGRHVFKQELCYYSTGHQYFYGKTLSFTNLVYFSAQKSFVHLPCPSLSLCIRVVLHVCSILTTTTEGIAFNSTGRLLFLFHGNAQLSPSLKTFFFLPTCLPSDTQQSPVPSGAFTSSEKADLL